MGIIGGDKPEKTKRRLPGQDWWESQPPKRRQQIAIGGVLAAVIGVGYILLTATDGGTSSRTRAPSDGKVTNSLLPNENAREIGMSGITKEMQDQRASHLRLEETVKRLQDERAAGEGRGGNTRNRELQIAQQLEQQKKEIDALKELLSAQSQQQQAAPTYDQEVDAGPAAPGGFGGIKVIRESKEEGSTSVPTGAGPAPAGEQGLRQGEISPDRSMYMPSGAIVSGVLITGLDAPTGRGATRDPVPVLIRVKKDAIMPNRYRTDVKECFILAAGAGDLASERAYLRSENMSCVRHDKSIIDIKIQAYAVDSDGKAGMRGRLVSKQGGVLSKAIMASFAEGVAQAFGGNRRMNMSSGNIDYAGGLESGAIAGASSALDRVAQYYLELADSMHPVLEIDAGRPITLVFVKGQELPTLR